MATSAAGQAVVDAEALGRVRFGACRSCDTAVLDGVTPSPGLAPHICGQVAEAAQGDLSAPAYKMFMEMTCAYLQPHRCLFLPKSFPCKTGE